MDLKKYGGYKQASYPYFYLIEKNNREAMICPINSFYKDDSKISLKKTKRIQTKASHYLKRY